MLGIEADITVFRKMNLRSLVAHAGLLISHCCCIGMHRTLFVCKIPEAGEPCLSIT
jgi:hypothetical protein